MRIVIVGATSLTILEIIRISHPRRTLGTRAGCLFILAHLARIAEVPPDHVCFAELADPRGQLIESDPPT
jgi:hypothetical protein